MTLIEIVSLALAPITGVVSWFASKKRHQADTDSVVVRNSSEVIGQWKELSDRYEKELNLIRGRLTRIELELEQERVLRKRVEVENGSLKKQIDELRKETL